METLEHAARIIVIARGLGRVTELGRDEVARLEELRARARRERDG